MSLLLNRTDQHPFSGMDVPWLLAQQAMARPEHPFVVWAPFDRPRDIDLQSSAAFQDIVRDIRRELNGFARS